MEKVNTEYKEAALPPYIAFQGFRQVASGDLPTVARAVKEVVDADSYAMVLVFDGITSERVELDLRGTPDDVLRRLAPEPNPTITTPTPEISDGPGRPKLGVVAREVTLLPRHWEWLSSQPGGASVALRKLVEEARRIHKDRDRIRQAQDSAYRFMSVMGGNEPGFEEASRAFFAKDRARFDSIIASWHSDMREHLQQLASVALADTSSS